MKIVFVSYTYWPPDFGGALIVTLEHLRDLVKRGHDVTVLTAGKPGFAGRENDGGLDVRRSPVVGRQRWARVLRRAFNFLWTVWYLLWAQYDVVHLGAMPFSAREKEITSSWSPRR